MKPLKPSHSSRNLLNTTPRQWYDLMRALIHASREALVVVDPRGSVFLANRTSENWFGQLNTKPLKTNLPQLAPFVIQTIADGKYRVDIPVRHQSGNYVSDLAPIVLSGDLVGVTCLLVRETTQNQMSRQIRHFKEMTSELDAIIDSSSDGLFVCDATANVIRINPASERIHGIQAESVIGKNMVDLIEEGFIDRSAALEASRSKTKVSLLQDKDNRKLISTATPVFNEEGQMIRVVVSERDMTEIDSLQRRLEEQAALKDQFCSQLLEMQQADLMAHKIIARSHSVVRTLEQALKVSAVNSSVLITGESGVGKGLIAKLIHQNSHRAQKPLMRINCGAIPDTLIESELFGYEPGAFTGAQAKGKPGHLELADGGTLFLDEVAELPLSAQVKLLRFLEGGRLTRLGGSKERQVDARILAATHRNLKEMVAQGTFRHDLYYRLNVIPLHVPPVRERKECILPLIRHYIDYFAKENKTTKRLSRSAVDALMAYPYPGNVRELMNICERAVVMSESEVIDTRDLPADLLDKPLSTPESPPQWPVDRPLRETLEQVECAVLTRAVEHYKNQSSIAAALGVSQPTVARRLKKYGLC